VLSSEGEHSAAASRSRTVVSAENMSPVPEKKIGREGAVMEKIRGEKSVVISLVFRP